MNLHLKIYNVLINRVPGIKERYRKFQEKNSGRKKILAWLYLIKLNIQFYIFRRKTLEQSLVLYPDKGKRICMDSESQLSISETPEELVQRLEYADVVSFDVFDTLILRKLNRPEDVFFIVQGKFNYPNLKKIRKEAERRARAERYEHFTDYEVTIEEIWNVVSKTTGIDADVGMAEEWEAEQKVCYANPYFLEVVRLLKEKKKMIVICSDMYLGAERIKTLLEKCGYPQFDKYYISSDFRKSKSNGTLYDVIRNELGNQLSYVQVGDNEHSDIRQAKNKNFKTYYYQSVNDIGDLYRAKDMSPIMSSIYSGIINGELHNGLYHFSREFEFGFIYGGLFVTGYCQFIHKYVKDNKIDKILFLARDGDILKQAYEKMYPSEREKCKYAYWSRLASVKLSARIMKAHYIERMIRHKIGQKYTLADIFHTMEIDDMLDDFLKENNKYSCKECSDFSSSLAGLVLDYVDRNWDTICTHYDSELEEGKKYYSELLQDAESAIAVDVGWVGTGAITLKRIVRDIWNIDCEIYGLLAGTCSGTGEDYESTAMECADGTLASYLFSSSENRDLWKIHDAAKGHNMIVELLLSSNELSFRGFNKNEKGEYDFNRTKEKVDVREIQRGILCFVEQYKSHPLGNLTISGRDAAAPIALLYENEKYIQNIINTSGIAANIE